MTSVEPNWSGIYGRLSLVVERNGARWRWAVSETRWGNLAQGNSETYDDARRTVESQGLRCKFLLAHGLVDRTDERHFDGDTETSDESVTQ